MSLWRITATMLANSYAVTVAAYGSNADSSRFFTSGNESKSIDRRRRTLSLSLSLSVGRARPCSSLRQPRAAPYSTRTRIRAYNIRQRCILLRRSVTHTYTRSLCSMRAHQRTRRFVVRRCVFLRAARTPTFENERKRARRFTSFPKHNSDTRVNAHQTLDPRHFSILSREERNACCLNGSRNESVLSCADGRTGRARANGMESARRPGASEMPWSAGWAGGYGEPSSPSSA